MATSDDPPFLTVGTEVSAKYRGAFCEATIKVAKKLVKCKVSYSKGNSALVSNEVVKGTLKVGSPVEVRQPDGQYLAASIVKLTDQSTYTVVFDDGDERTLKRSSLCLKGGRHFDKSESLDNLPLTDPENFGTPVLHSTKKPSRKRRRCSQSPSRKEEENGKRPCSYPERFPVGKAVFLENDRRRSCWLPAVIVPAHYVMEESDRTPDTICLRSFKDGRFFASTKDELHDFAPDKEPLLSMLEGEIQPMYMCKPAIERAMAYLDTGELPWDMDLFDKTIEHRSATPTDEEETGDEVVAEVEEFNEKLKKFHESKGTPMVRRPTLGQKDLNLFKLYKLVKENGGMEKVTQELKWRSLHLQMGMPNMTNASYAIKQAYKKYLYAFEIHEKGGKGGKQSVKESLGSWTNQRRKRNLEERSSEEREKSVIEKLLDQSQSSPEVEEKSDPVQPPTDSSKSKVDQSKKLFQEAMQSGYVVLRTIVLLLIGVAGAGKTCFCHMLFDEPPPPVRESTPLAKSSIRANCCIRDKGLSLKKAIVSQIEGTIFWERISAEMFNSLIADGIKSFQPGTNPGAIAECLPVLLSAVSEDLQLRVVPPIEHTIVAHEKYKKMDVAQISIVSHRELSDIDQLFEMESVKKLLGMISRSKGSVELLRQEWLFIIDSGGQPQFHELLPTFVRHVSAVAFFVKLNETLATRPMIEYYSKGGVSACEPYQSSQTNLQVIQNCLQAMQARCLIEDTAECPELFFIGTHYDLESEIEPLSDKNAQLSAMLHQHDIFREHLAYSSLGSVDQLLYPVNAQTPSAADKVTVASLRKDVMEKCQKHERQIPIRWFVLESLLQELSQNGVISFEKCLEVAGHLGMDEVRLRAAIKYLVQLNIFEFYSDVLPKVIFTTSQILLTKVTELVEYSHLLRNHSVSGCSSDDKEFRDNGYVSVKFLEHERFASHFVSGLFEAKDLLTLLEDRLVITRQDSGKFVMMAVLSDLEPEKFEKHRLAISKSATHVPIAVHYPGSLFPVGIFMSLVSHLQSTSNWKILVKEGKPACFFKNCIDFVIRTSELNANITLFYTHQWIEIYLRIYDEPQQACYLRSVVLDGLARAAEVQKYRHITPVIAFLCPCEQDTLDQQSLPHIATVTPNNRYLCCSKDESNLYPLTEGHHLWMSPSDSKEVRPHSKSGATAATPSSNGKSNAVSKKLSFGDSQRASGFMTRRVDLRHLNLIRWKDDQGRTQRFFLKDKISPKWRDIGELIRLTHPELDTISNKYRGDPKECCRAVLGQWLDNPPPDYPTTWQGLLELLEDSQLGQVVTELREILDKASL